jgi:ABC-type transporter Mla subunit MlaD
MDIGSLFLELLRNYFTFGWPFFLLHIGVLGLSVYTWTFLYREITHLEKWATGSSSGSSQAAQILHQFIAESRKLSPQGFFVPITDFSDRLDSIIEGRVTELYERINLFLIVGIAGTLFGVFEFASGASKIMGTDTISSADRVVRLGEILSASLAKAFPVGFVGLVLMFLGQIGVSFWENRLRRVIAKATSIALHYRMEASATQAQVIANAAAKIETALAPIQNLQVMMTETLGPVVQALGERLDDSLGLVKEQFGQLETTTASFSSAVTGLRDGVAALEKNTEHIGALLQHTPEVLGRLSQLQRDQEQALKEFRENLRTSLEESERTLAVLESATQASRDLPGRILAATQEALSTISQDSTRVSSALADEVRQQLTAASADLSQHLRSNSESLFGSMQGQSEALQALIRTTGGQLIDVGSAAREAVAGIQEVRKEARAGLEASFIEMGRESGGRWGKMTDEFGRQTQNEFFQFIEGIRGSAREIRESLDEAARSWGTVAVNAETMIQGPIIKVLENVGGELRRGVRDLDSLIADRYPRAVHDCRASATCLSSARCSAFSGCMASISRPEPGCDGGRFQGLPATTGAAGRSNWALRGPPRRLHFHAD